MTRSAISLKTNLRQDDNFKSLLRVSLCLSLSPTLPLLSLPPSPHTKTVIDSGFPKNRTYKSKAINSPVDHNEASFICFEWESGSEVVNEGH